MKSYLTEKEKSSHTYYRIMELRGEELNNKLNSWTRVELIDWLCWNDQTVSTQTKILGVNLVIFSQRRGL